MLAINKARSTRAHLSPRYKGPVDSGGYTPEPNGLPDPASLKALPAKHDARLQKAVAEIQADSIRNGTDKLTLKEINAEIEAVRTARRTTSSKR
jgi:hypothetical protein